MDSGSIAPVVEGDIIEEFEIVGVGKKGDGIGKVDNFVIMVPNTEQGKTYKVKITKVLSKFGFGTLDLENEY